MNTEFTTFWKLYPRKREKKDAEKAWNSLMKRGVKSDAILSTLQDRLRTDWRKRTSEFIPYAASFLRAEDFDDEFEARVDDKELLLPLTAQKQHYCEACADPHWWTCEDEFCCAGSEMACRVYVERLCKLSKAELIWRK